MMAATLAIQRPAAARLLAVDRHGRIEHHSRSAFVDLLRSGDLVVANDAATLPASLTGVHEPSGRRIEARLAGLDTALPAPPRRYLAILFGLGDFHMRTEDRPGPPPVRPGDVLQLGPLRARVDRRLFDHPRFVSLAFEGSARTFWEGIARHGRPIQYSHLTAPLRVWDTWTSIAGPLVAFEPPSAGFVLDWRTIAVLKARHVGFETLTHAAGISSTGDPLLDRRLPLDEPYSIPATLPAAIAHARSAGGRVIAIGTTVVRALEHATGSDDVVRVGVGVATQRISATTRLRTVDAILSGTHEPGTSHYDLLHAFAPGVLVRAMDAELEGHGYLTHEFGDSVFVERAR